MSLDAAKLAALLAPILDELRAPEPLPAVEALAVVFMTRVAYAERVSVSARTLDTLIGRGLPCIGRGRLLRVDVAAADRWLREHLAEDAPEAEDEVSRAAQASVDKALRGSR